MPQSILPSFNLKTTKNLESDHLYPDEPGIKRYNSKFPYKVHYKFNSRGYRDSEWPIEISDLKSSVWCIGDSATVGIGSPQEHIWPQLLSRVWNQRTINVSLIAASNDFIERKCIELLDQIEPEYIILCWSYLHRRDSSEQNKITFIANETQKNWDDFYSAIRRTAWPDCHSLNDVKNLEPKIQQEILSKYQDPIIEIDDEMSRFINKDDVEKFFNSAASRSTQEEVEYFMSKIHNIKQHQHHTQIFHMFVPEFATKTESELVKQNFSRIGIPFHAIEQIDYARDNHHWDIKTSNSIVAELTKLKDN
jgi:hypothetical protein